MKLNSNAKTLFGFNEKRGHPLLVLFLNSISNSFPHSIIRLFVLRVIHQENVTLSMEISFFATCPLAGGLSVPAQTLRTSNEPMSPRADVRLSFDFAHGPEFVEGFVEWRRIEPDCRYVVFGAWQKKTSPCFFLYVVCQEKHQARLFPDQ